MNRKFAVAGIAALVCLVFVDVAVNFVVVREHWRPVPPFGSLTNERQADWVDGRIRALPKSSATGEVVGERFGIFDADLGWSLRANATSADGLTHTNSRGWRGQREYANVASPGQLRIVCAGDSFTFCEEVGDRESWPFLLEERLEGTAEVVNLGVGGYGTDQALLRFGSDYPRAKVDVVFIGLLLENIGRNVNRYRPLWYPRADSAGAKPRFIEGAETLQLISLPYDSELQLLNAIVKGDVLEDLREHEFWSNDYVPGIASISGLWRMVAGRLCYRERELPRLWADTEGEPFRVTTRLLGAFSAFAQSPEGNSARLAPVLIFPTRDDLARFEATGERYWQPLIDWLIVEEMPHIDLTEALAAAEGGDALWKSSHLSKLGNDVVAGVLAEFLAAQF